MNPMDLTISQQEQRQSIQARFFKAKASVENSLLEMGFCLLEAQENPHLYPEYQHESSGKLNVSLMLREEFGVKSNRAFQLISFAELRSKIATRVAEFPHTERQARVLAPYKDDDETLEAIIERAKEVTDGTLKLTASQLSEVVANVVGEGAPDLDAIETGPEDEPIETEEERIEREAEEAHQERLRKIDEEHRESQEKIRETHERAERMWERIHEKLNDLLNSPGVKMDERQKVWGKAMLELGFKAASKKAHPDAGGTHEDMVALNNAKDIMLAAILR